MPLGLSECTTPLSMKQMTKLLALPLYILYVWDLNLEQETGGPVEGFCCLPKSL